MSAETITNITTGICRLDDVEGWVVVYDVTTITVERHTATSPDGPMTEEQATAKARELAEVLRAGVGQGGD